MASLSTAFSDTLLALSSYHCSHQLYGSSYCGFVGFLIIGFAATAGAIRFALVKPNRTIISFHAFLSWLASVLGTSCIAAAYHRQALFYSFANAHLALALALTMLCGLLSDKVYHYISEGVSTGAIVSQLLLSVFRFNPFGLVGAVLYTLAGLVIGTRGHWMGLPRVDWFHYVLIIGNIALMKGLNYEDQPLFYTSTHTST